MTTSRNTLPRRLTLRATILVGVLLLINQLVSAETLTLIKDINTCSDTVPTGQIARLTKGVVTTTSFSKYGQELAIVSGDRPLLVKDLSPGEESSTINFLFVFKDYAYFDLLTANGERALWRSNGTNTGTTLVVDYDNGMLSAQRVKFSQALDDFYVVHTTSAENLAESIFWVGNGSTVEGRSTVDNFPGHALKDTRVIGATSNALVIRGDSTELGAEPYVLRAAGKLTLLDDIIPGAVGSNPLEAIEIAAGRTILFASSSNTSTALYSVNLATSAKPVVIDELKPSGGTSRFRPNSALISSRLYYVVSGGGLSGIWATDGTPNQSQRLSLPDWVSSSSSLSILGSFQGRVLFCNRSGSLGCEPILSDGTADGTVLLKDIYPGDGQSFSRDFTPHPTKPLLVFSAMELAVGQELYRSDGTAGGTSLIADIKKGPSPSIPRDFYLAKNGSIEFVADSFTGSMLLTLDPSSFEIKPKALLSGGLSASSSPNAMISLDGENLIFEATTCRRGKDYQLLQAASGQVSPLFADEVSIVQDRVTLLTTMADIAFFTVSTPEMGAELWVAHGEPRSAKLLKDISAGPEGSYPNNGGVVSGRYIFAAENFGANQLWSSDGTAEGTKVLRADLNALQGISEGVKLPADPKTLYFLATFRGSNRSRFALELWSTQGTPETTRSIAGIGEPSTTIYPRAPIVVGNRLVFPGFTNAAGVELWGSDGSAAATGALADLTPGLVGSATFLNSAVFKGRVYFPATDGKMIESDGTAAGTKWSDIFKEAAAGASGVVMHATEKILFAKFFNGTRSQLHITNGELESSLSELAPLVTLANPGAASLIGEDFYFEAINAGGNRELWKSDGTAKGTRFVVGSNARKSIAFRALHSFGKGIVLNAADSAVGNELFLLASESDQRFTDFCPADPRKKFPGVCGCGVPDTDADGDGWSDCNDQCPLNGFLAQAEQSPCVCEVERKDVNRNGIADCLSLDESRFHLKRLRTAARSLKIKESIRLKQSKRSLKIISRSTKQLRQLQKSGASFYSAMSNAVYQSELNKLARNGEKLRKLFQAMNDSSFKKIKKKFLKSIRTLSASLAATNAA